MSSLKRAILLLILIVLGVLALQNLAALATPVQLDFFTFDFPEMALAFWLGCAFLAGYLVAGVLHLKERFLQARRIRELERLNRDLRQRQGLSTPGFAERSEYATAETAQAEATGPESQT
jgi:uncharacterized integral membrane protein